MPNNLLYIVLDSCRYDSFIAAKTPNISRLGKLERRYSYASWTLPSHHAFMMGAIVHDNPPGVYASEVYKKSFLTWSNRLGLEGIGFKDFVPYLSLPAFLKDQGYRTSALVSMPVLNPLTVLNKHFDRYELMDAHNDFDAIINTLTFGADPSFYLINVGETHYPYTIKGESVEDKQLLYGSQGVFKHSGDETIPGLSDANRNLPETYYKMDCMQALQQKQIRNVEHLDGLFAKLFEIVPKNTHILVTADHGELFGEAGFFGHGPIMHEKVFEVFLIEGKIK